VGFSAKLLIAVGVVWAALMPPLFTGGSCTAEFERESATLEHDRASLRSSTQAEAYWRQRSVPYAVLSVDQCRSRKPRNLERCGEGPLVMARVPVKDAICRIYRDDEMTVWLYYDARDRLARQRLDMNPYKSLPIPFTNSAIHWAR
jgi:hypothetical protein